MANALTDLTAFKLHLNISTSTEDARLTAFLDQAVAHIQSEAKQYLADKTWTEYHRGDGSRTLILKQLPARSITSVHLDNDAYWGQGTDSPFGATTLLVEGEDYALQLDDTLPVSDTAVSRTGFLVRLNGVWDDVTLRADGRLVGKGGVAPGNIKVVYAAGYPSADVPLDLKLLCHQVAAVIRREAPEGVPLASESVEGYSYTVRSAVHDVMSLASSQRILSRFRDWVA